MWHVFSSVDARQQHHLQLNRDVITLYSPISIDVFGSQGSSDSSHNGTQNARHTVQVVNSTGVLDLQFFLQEWLSEVKEKKGKFMVYIAVPVV